MLGTRAVSTAGVFAHGPASCTGNNAIVRYGISVSSMAVTFAGVIKTISPYCAPTPPRVVAVGFSAFIISPRFPPISSLPETSGRSSDVSLLTWNDSYSVGVQTIAQQHAGLFAIVNVLHAAMMQGQTQNVAGPLLDKLIKYTVQHFAYEERLMEAAKYPGLAVHRAHHATLTRQVQEFMTRFKRGDSGLTIELLHFLSDWLTKHIQREDKEYRPWLTRHAA